MFKQLPSDARDALSWGWADFQPYFDNLLTRNLTEATFDAWMTDVSQLDDLIDEISNRLYVAKDLDTTDDEAKDRYFNFVENVEPEIVRAFNKIQHKLIDSGLETDAIFIPLRNVHNSVELFRDENIDLSIQLEKLGSEYDRIAGAQTIMWDGEERTTAQMAKVYLERDRDRREAAFQAVAERKLQDREALNNLWVEMVQLRRQMAKNAGFDSYLDYRWKQLNRHDYTPEDTLKFHEAIEAVVVPAAKEIYERRRQRLGLDTLRPWDTSVPVTDAPPLHPFDDVSTLIDTTSTLFNKLNDELGGLFDTMRDEQLLDLDNRKGKAPGGYCTDYPASKRPFIFMNAVGLHDDVQTMLHEAGHAFHAFATMQNLPYSIQRNIPMEFAEVASMAMELLAAPYLPAEQGGFYSEDDAARARIEHLEGNITFWAYMAVVDAWQHWAYTCGDDVLDPAKCDAKWAELYNRFMQGIDYSGLDDWLETGWHRKLHIYQVPFYYIEYGLAQLGAVQVWANSLDDHATALKQYREALALGNTVKLPELFATAGAKLAFDSDTLGQAVDLMLETIHELDPA